MSTATAAKGCLQEARLYVQATAAHEAAIGGGHVTTWTALRGHVVDDQIVDALTAVQSQADFKNDSHSGGHTSQ